MTGIACRRFLLAVLLCITPLPAAKAELPPDCPGDCDGNGAVTIDELIRGVRLALGDTADCLSSFDRDADGRAEVAELLLGVRNLVAGCEGRRLTFDFDFADGALGWRAGFADYPAGEEQLYELEQGIRPLPDELGASATGFLLSGNNHSDDLLMFLTRRLGREDGVVAGQAYDVSFEIRFASNAPSDCPGIGGAPGESVYLKAGASGIEPLAVPGSEGLLVLNVDKGNQGSGGADVSLAGNIANGMPCGLDVPYVSLRRSHTHPSPVVASDVGEIWLLIGTDSGFEGTTALYYESVEVSLSPTDETPPPTVSPTPRTASRTRLAPGDAIATDRSCRPTRSGCTFGTKTAIFIPDDVYAAAERLARKLRKSRSQLYAEAVAEYVARHDPEEILFAGLDVVLGR